MAWKTVRLCDIGKVVGGATPSTKDLANYGNEVPWITPKDLSGLKKRYIARGERSITIKGFNSCSTVMLPQNSVLFSSRAPIGLIAIAKNPLCTNQGFKSVIPNEKIDPLFLFYALKAATLRIQTLGSGTTFKEVSGSVMRNVEIYIPEDINEQRQIAQILDNIDSKIELNSKINDNLVN